MALAGIGIDVIEIHRIAAAIDNLGARFLDRIYTPLEQKYCNRFNPRAPHYAARFAAKEAAMKALGVGIYSRIPWTDYEILNRESGEPYLVLHQRALVRAEERGAGRWFVSLSHNKGVAVAVVIMEAAT